MIEKVLRGVKLCPNFTVTLSGLEGPEVPEADQVALLQLIPDRLDHGVKDSGGFRPGEAVLFPDHFGKFAVIHSFNRFSSSSIPLAISRRLTAG